MKRGFTLLEVMVAIAILGLSLSAIFSSEAGAIRMASRSGKMGMAALLVRCKMNEIEEMVADEGLPAVFASGSDGCCEDGELDGFSCDWEINPVVLPESMFTPEDAEDELEEEMPKEEDGFAIGGKDGLNTTNAQEILAGGPVDGLAATAMGYVYPILKPSFEQQIRRATVTVRWAEGRSEKSFDVTQYLVADQGVALDTEEPAAEDPNGQDPNSAAPGAAPATPGGSQGSGSAGGLLPSLFGVGQ